MENGMKVSAHVQSRLCGRSIRAVAMLSVVSLQACDSLPLCPPSMEPDHVNVDFHGKDHRGNDFLLVGTPVRASLTSKVNVAGPFRYCASIEFDFGDGSPRTSAGNTSQVADTNLFSASHLYEGFPARRKIVARCSNGGRAETAVVIGMPPDGMYDFRLAFKANPVICQFQASPGSQPIPQVRAGSIVFIKPNGLKINYGGGKEFGAGGDPSAAVPSGYPFPDKRKYSIVYKVGAENFQAEDGRSHFQPSTSGPLQFCVNDNPNYLGDNFGGIAFDIFVDESGLP